MNPVSSNNNTADVPRRSVNEPQATGQQGRSRSTKTSSDNFESNGGTPPNTPHTASTPSVARPGVVSRCRAGAANTLRAIKSAGVAVGNLMGRHKYATAALVSLGVGLFIYPAATVLGGMLVGLSVITAAAALLMDYTSAQRPGRRPASADPASSDAPASPSAEQEEVSPSKKSWGSELPDLPTASH